MIRVKKVKSKPEVNDGISKTTPDMALSVKDIIKRHTRGQSVPTQGDPIFEIPAGTKITEDMFGEPDYSMLSHVDKIQEKMRLDEDIDEMQEKLKHDEKSVKTEKAKQKKVAEAKKLEEQKPPKTGGDVGAQKLALSE